MSPEIKQLISTIPYPRIVEKIEIMWGTIELDRYLNSLLIDDRGNRAGWPPGVSTTIFSLLVKNSAELKADWGNVSNSLSIVKQKNS